MSRHKYGDEEKEHKPLKPPTKADPKPATDDPADPAGSGPAKDPPPPPDTGG